MQNDYENLMCHASEITDAIRKATKAQIMARLLAANGSNWNLAVKTTDLIMKEVYE